MTAGPAGDPARFYVLSASDVRGDKPLLGPVVLFAQDNLVFQGAKAGV